LEYEENSQTDNSSGEGTGRDAPLDGTEGGRQTDQEFEAALAHQRKMVAANKRRAI
jgi:hypothetical protein